MQMTVSDEALAMAAAGGDRAAYADLVERHYDRIFALCWRLTGQQSEAEDLTQDIFAALPAKLRGWRNDARLTTWLYRVAVNAAHDRRRRAATHAKAALGWGDWEKARQADIAAEAEGQDWLQGAMASLSEELRDTVALILGEGLSQAEAAEVLGLSEGTVAWRMSEVKKKLRAVAQEETR
ncbi:RNA polymerase sigma-70 factor (ECF subfamily) [Paracoccus sulfuroxidans]|uniref:RNA polymerase sigma-70 factor (ECF subfamily) n=2 Tax=Paracoccus sulfuroxidans TaxID=384678 RepID=A0A562NAN4_9RHOB|nr:RNA polymerase sigma-70 factor (ECF subfamily) [Paracoccus sulfuroxidans]